MRRPLAALLLTACASTAAAPAPPASPIAVPGAPRDRNFDGDGVLDPKDLCSHEVGMNAYGRPLPDGDGDTLYDRDDRCPDDPGVAPDGCPGDGDGPPLTRAG